MKKDLYIQQLTILRHQKFFLEAWFNITHENSLDSHRVRCMNPINIVREFVNLKEKSFKVDDDLSRVKEEVILIIEEDNLLQKDKWKEQRYQFLSLIKNSKDNDQESQSLIKYFARDLLEKLEAEYAEDLLEELRVVLLKEEVTDQEYLIILDLTKTLLSCLIDAGYSIEALFAVYMEVLSGRKKDNYTFVRAYDLTCRLVSRKETSFRIFLRLEGLKKAESMREVIGAITFYFTTDVPIDPINNVDERIKGFFVKGQGRCFCSIDVKSVDFRSAGVIAHEKVSSLLDLIRFEFENSVISIDENFAGLNINESAKLRIFKIPSKVPNPRRNIDESQLSEFINTVEAIVLSRHLDNEGRDRIKSTFRLYRSGLDSGTFEQKLVNWWTGLEYLIKGNSSSGKIGEAVENYLTPVLCLDYLSKHIETYKKILVSESDVKRKEDASITVYRDYELKEMFDQLRNEVEVEKMKDIINSPFIEFELKKFSTSIKTPAEILRLIQAHEQRVRWHIRRIYRARCDIVHSAERILNASLLCANLEFYLKSILGSLLNEFGKTSSLSGPKEFLDRSSHLYKLTLESLKSNDESLIKKNFHTGMW